MSGDGFHNSVLKEFGMGKEMTDNPCKDIQVRSKKKWCKHEKTMSVYHAYSEPPEIVQCCLCGACHVEPSYKGHTNLK